MKEEQTHAASSSHIKTLLKMRKGRHSTTVLKRGGAPNADISGVFGKEREDAKGQFPQEESKEYKQIQRALKGEVDSFQDRQSRQKKKLKRNFEEMDELLEDLHKWRESQKEEKKEIQSAAAKRGDVGDLYLTELHAQQEEADKQREEFEKKFRQADERIIPRKSESIILQNNAREAVKIRERVHRSEFDKLKDLQQNRLRQEIEELEGKQEELDKQLAEMGAIGDEDDALLAQIDDITNDMQKWEKELSETMEGLTLIEYSRGLKVPSIGEEKGEEGVGDNEGQKTSMAAMLKDIENEFASVEDLFK